MRANPRPYALAAAVALLVVTVAIVSTGRRPEPPVTTPSSDAAPTTAPLIADAPRAIFGRHVVFDTVPGGGPVLGPGYDAFVVLSASRPAHSRPIAGVALGPPVFDGRDRVAYWRIPRTPPSGSAAGPYEVVVWDVRADRERVLLSLADERSNGGLLWTADKKSLIVPTRTAPAAARPTQNRLLLIDVDTGASRALHVSSGDTGIGPLYADARVVVALRGSSYLVLDATSGVVSMETPMRVPSTPMGQWGDFASADDGTVLELFRRFESDAGPLRVWHVRDPGSDIAKVDQRGIWDPIFWPGRTEVVFSGATGLLALDYRTGLTRQLASPPDVHRIVAIESSGRYALGQTETRLQIFERSGDDLKARPDLSFTAESILHPLGVFLP